MIPAIHDGFALGFPGRGHEAAHLAPERFLLPGRRSAKDAPLDFLVTEEPRLAGHHPLFGGDVDVSVELEAREVPL